MYSIYIKVSNGYDNTPQLPVSSERKNNISALKPPLFGMKFDRGLDPFPLCQRSRPSSAPGCAAPSTALSKAAPRSAESARLPAPRETPIASRSCVPGTCPCFVLFS